MARASSTYRVAKRNAARVAGTLNTWGITNKDTPHTYDRATRRSILRTIWQRRKHEGHAAQEAAQ